jgi:predicted negative regulator of RcsB-dependent stress response
LNFAPRASNSIKPVTEREQAAINEGDKFRQDATAYFDQAPAAIDRVDRVLQTISKIESSREFKAGKAGELEAQLRQMFGEAEYKLLQKEIADLVIQTNQVTGGKTDAAAALVSESVGNTSFPPGVLKNVVTKLRGDAYGAMMKAQGAQAFINNGFGEANLRNYRDAWNKNADPRVFEAMAIFGSDRLTADQKKAAFDKIKPTNLESLDAFERKYTNLESLARTGALPPPQRPAR